MYHSKTCTENEMCLAVLSVTLKFGRQ